MSIKEHQYDIIFICFGQVWTEIQYSKWNTDPAVSWGKWNYTRSEHQKRHHLCSNSANGEGRQSPDTLYGKKCSKQTSYFPSEKPCWTTRCQQPMGKLGSGIIMKSFQLALNGFWGHKHLCFFFPPRIQYLENVTVRLKSKPGKATLQKALKSEETWNPVKISTPSETMSALLPSLKAW